MAPPLSIAIVGGGSIGSSIALKLMTMGKHNVTIVARPGSMRLVQLQQDGIVTAQGDICRVPVVEALDATVPYDLVIVTTLAHQAESLLPLLKTSAATSILFLFHIFNPERLLDIFGERASFGLPFIQASNNEEGVLHATFSMKTPLGARRWVNLFNTSGIPAVYEPKMALWLRCHTSFCIGLVATCVVAKRREAGATWQEARTAALALHATNTVIKSLGYPLYPSAKVVMDKLPTAFVAGFLWLFSRIKVSRNQLGKGKAAAECYTLVDSVVDVAQKAGLQSVIPVLHAVKTL
ncbi:hypothetical protein BKA62DRAFT_709800 [Auriculariales sp. MPI-PUGE-AT-0066]|nr:hypothetical protein BKA62DRAFT_709800 [Auriculariales sp. MPI-PUGE-AT-0066]